MNLKFDSEVEGFTIDNALELNKWLKEVSRQEFKKLGEIVYRFVSEETILRVNQEFLKHNYLTDIITFDTSYLKIVSGEIYICVTEVRQNAIQHNATEFENELYRVMVHGLLHLVGYSDKTEQERRIMRLKEDYYLNLLDSSYFKR